MCVGHSEDLHCGTHTENIRACATSRLLKGYMALIPIKAAKLWAAGLTTVRVWCLCENGVHKSLAVAKIMQDTYHHEGYNTKGPYPMNPDTDVCWNCDSCKPNHDTDVCMCAVAANAMAYKLFQHLNGVQLECIAAGKA